jgi:hypothetical protein
VSRGAATGECTGVSADWNKTLVRILNHFLRDVEDGQVSYQRKIAPAEIFTFYQETMPGRGWQPNSWFAGQKDQIAYTKGNRVALIYYTPTPDGTTVLTLMVGTQYPPK